MNLAIVDKRLPAPNEAQVLNVIGDVKGRDVVLYDDMVDMGDILVTSAQALKAEWVPAGLLAGLHARGPVGQGHRKTRRVRRSKN